MANVWSHGTWTIREGEEDAFVAAWKAMAARVSDDSGLAGAPTLLRDRERPNAFVSFAPWRSVEAVDAFRSSDVFRDGLASMEGIVESLEPQTLDEVSPGG